MSGFVCAKVENILNIYLEMLFFKFKAKIKFQPNKQVLPLAQNQCDLESIHLLF